MTAATSFRSWSTPASRSTIEAIVTTSYGVRFFCFAYFMFTREMYCLNASSWRPIRSSTLGWRGRSYVAGNRKPSRFGGFCAPYLPGSNPLKLSLAFM